MRNKRIKQIIRKKIKEVQHQKDQLAKIDTNNFSSTTIRVGVRFARDLAATIAFGKIIAYKELLKEL